MVEEPLYPIDPVSVEDGFEPQSHCLKVALYLDGPGQKGDYFAPRACETVLAKEARSAIISNSKKGLKSLVFRPAIPFQIVEHQD